MSAVFLQRTHPFGGYFQMSLPVHLACVKRTWPEAMHCEPETQICGFLGGYNTFVAALDAWWGGGCGAAKAEISTNGLSGWLESETYDSIKAVKFKCPEQAPKPNDHHCVYAAAPFWFIFIYLFMKF